MPSITPQIGAASAPRFEFRAFGQDFDRVHHRMGRFSVPVPEPVWERHSDELYIVSQHSDTHNTKIRDGKVDIKALVQTLEGLEQWRPVMKGTFPLTEAVMRADVAPAFGVPWPPTADQDWDFEAFRHFVDAQPGLQAVHVRKQRFGYLVHDTICEYAVVLINGARVVTVATESTDRAALHRTIVDTGMTGLENINYLHAIKRVLGMHPTPLAATPSGAIR